MDSLKHQFLFFVPTVMTSQEIHTLKSSSPLDHISLGWRYLGVNHNSFNPINIELSIQPWDCIHYFYWSSLYRSNITKDCFVNVDGELHSWKLASSHTWNSGSNKTKMLTVQRHTYTWPKNKSLKLPGSYINYAIKPDSKTQLSFPTTLKQSSRSQQQRNSKVIFSWTAKQSGKASDEQEPQLSSTQDPF